MFIITNKIHPTPESLNLTFILKDPNPHPPTTTRSPSPSQYQFVFLLSLKKMLVFLRSLYSVLIGSRRDGRTVHNVIYRP